jgi:hypothetical protein
MSDYDRKLWQAEQIAQEEAQSAYRDKIAKARERSANNAKRKIARLHAKLTELGHISEFEDEFGESVLERLEKYGSAFHDPEKGRAGDALSTAQRQVVSRMNKKLKELKAKQRAGVSEAENPDADYVRTADQWKKDAVKKSGFKSKRKSKFSPRIRHIEDEMMDDVAPPVTSSSVQPKLSIVGQASDAEFVRPHSPEPEKTANLKRPFLRIVPKI